MAARQAKEQIATLGRKGAELILSRRLADGLTIARAVVGLPLIVALSLGQARWPAAPAPGGFSDADGWSRRAGGIGLGSALDPLTDSTHFGACQLGAAGALPLWAIWLQGLSSSSPAGGPRSGGPLPGRQAKTILQFTALLLLLSPGRRRRAEIRSSGHPGRAALSSARGYLKAPATDRRS